MIVSSYTTYRKDLELYLSCIKSFVYDDYCIYWNRDALYGWQQLLEEEGGHGVSDGAWNWLRRRNHCCGRKELASRLHSSEKSATLRPCVDCKAFKYYSFRILWFGVVHDKNTTVLLYSVLSLWREEIWWCSSPVPCPAYFFPWKYACNDVDMQKLLSILSKLRYSYYKFTKIGSDLFFPWKKY